MDVDIPVRKNDFFNKAIRSKIFEMSIEEKQDPYKNILCPQPKQHVWSNDRNSKKIFVNHLKTKSSSKGFQYINSHHLMSKTDANGFKRSEDPIKIKKSIIRGQRITGSYYVEDPYNF